jgi:hypothetical protein
MANWTRHADGRLETGIGGERYRANLHSSRQGGDWWAAEVMHRGEWTRIGSLLESERACAAGIEDYARHLAEKSGIIEQMPPGTIAIPQLRHWPPDERPRRGVCLGIMRRSVAATWLLFASCWQVQ